MTKVFRLKAHEIAPLAPGRGGCIASDRITVDGMPVGYMYRTVPHNDLDSGWAFLAGDEDQDYLDDPDLHGIYDVNTIANYDPAIIPFLDSPEGWQLLRSGDGMFHEPAEPEYERVDPRTASFIERGGAEGWQDRRRATIRAMWIVMGHPARLRGDPRPGHVNGARRRANRLLGRPLFWNISPLWCKKTVIGVARSLSAPNDARLRLASGTEGGVVMDTRIYEKGSRAGPLWAAVVALMIGLGLAFALGA